MTDNTPANPSSQANHSGIEYHRHSDQPDILWWQRGIPPTISNGIRDTEHDASRNTKDDADSDTDPGSRQDEIEHTDHQGCQDADNHSIAMLIKHPQCHETHDQGQRQVHTIDKQELPEQRAAPMVSAYI